ncbi:hypothetical protein HJFPF1_02339 [Paramyrothecium foliicola]|nr:hypothetical protein HJFPF1_02339 [Paramyrothecium foliicola]
MRLNFAAFLAVFATLSVAQWDNESPAPIEPAPAPWTLKGTIYSITFVPTSIKLPTKAYSPLERQFTSAAEGNYLGGLGLIQIIRYTDSPVGPYDELLLVPGYFKYDYKGPNGREEERKNVRITRIYVSQKYTYWNIPKHLARFDWSENNRGETTVKIYPHDTTGNPSESEAASKPWFKATFKPDLLSGLPFSTDLYQILGINTTLAQPPLPQADSKYGELAGTQHWAATLPEQETKDASLGFFDLGQGDGDVEEGEMTNAVGDEYFPNFWPGLLRLHPGMKLENATITFNAPLKWQD